MKRLILGIALAALLAACSEQEKPPSPAVIVKASGDAAAGKAVAEQNCKTCHGLDGRGLAPGIPNLAGQREPYLLLALTEYREVKRAHAALRDLAGRLTEEERRNVVAYYAAQPPVAISGKDEQHTSLLERGSALAAACVKCHGEEGNSRTPGIPSLAGQQPHYLVTAIQEYHRGERKKAPMDALLRNASVGELESLALYFASRTPAQRAAPSLGDPKAGELLTAMCGGCHGPNGDSSDAATPSLAGQDPQYLLKAIRAYRTSRKHWGMQRYVAGLTDQDMENISAFYAVQPSKPAGTVPSSARELAAKCDRCHDSEDTPKMVVPILRGQDKDYLVMALRAYRDDKRESSTMHRMSAIYSNVVIDDIASYYASLPRDKR